MREPGPPNPWPSDNNHNYFSPIFIINGANHGFALFTIEPGIELSVLLQ
jgi:hypothetical protein